MQHAGVQFTGSLGRVQIYSFALTKPQITADMRGEVISAPPFLSYPIGAPLRSVVRPGGQGDSRRGPSARRARGGGLSQRAAVGAAMARPRNRRGCRRDSLEHHAIRLARAQQAVAAARPRSPVRRRSSCHFAEGTIPRLDRRVRGGFCGH